MARIPLDSPVTGEDPIPLWGTDAIICLKVWTKNKGANKYLKHNTKQHPNKEQVPCN